MASAQNISVEVNAELVALVAKLEAQLKQTEKHQTFVLIACR